MEKILSICIPTFSRCKVLKNTINNFIDQIVKNNLQNEVEIIVSDNASKDDTKELLAEF